MAWGPPTRDLPVDAPLLKLAVSSHRIYMLDTGHESPG
eukprot:CAMPEP_0174362162 /NCGR_PEP_ID=MMETSP0811_2-20130205/63023_1 /TAXON_ID=73025 ORGANISM="Eutreptiella gymnastica-like, Strain CCMP1594" /NCGR_SAMPLE_ID=MMETSP0811_2 /ASSEMBLY_ACC=CAM_ASM_000667 /LENGTH=37 /DNA_ID= /DNA_START= /DNA_END= /DNA_ORIENTATION=